MIKNSPPVGVAVIGCGSISQWSHLPAYAAMAETGLTKIVAVCDSVTERAAEMAAKYQAKAYTDYQSLLKNTEIQAVSVCTPNFIHAEVSIAALNAGKHVLCEKPMAVTAAEAEAMIAATTAAAAKSGLKLMIAQSQRFAPAHIKAKAIVESNVLGKIFSFDTAFCHGGPEGWCADKSNKTWFFRKNAAHFGAMGDLGVHKIDLIHYLLGEKIVETAAFIGTFAKKDENDQLISVDDNAVCILKTEHGILGQLTAAWTHAAGENNYTRIYGENGILRIYDDPDYAIIVTKKDGETIYHKLREIFTNDKPEPNGVYKAFIGSIIHGTEPPVNGCDGYQALKVILACFESSRTGRIVKIEP